MLRIVLFTYLVSTVLASDGLGLFYEDLPEPVALNELFASVLDVESSQVTKLESYTSNCYSVEGTDDNYCFPKAIIIGATKAGSSSMRDWLSYHPQIQMLSREGVFFENPGKIEAHLIKYLSRFPSVDSEGDLVAEKTPGYLWRSTVEDRGYTARTLYQLEPDAKLVIVLRDPVARAQSHYEYFNSKHPEGTAEDFDQLINKRISSLASCVATLASTDGLSNDQKEQLESAHKDVFDMRAESVTFLGEEVSMSVFAPCMGDLSQFAPDREILSIGLYWFWIRVWLRYFPRDQLDVVFLDDMEKDAAGTVDAVVEYLDLPMYFFTEEMLTKSNTGKSKGKASFEMLDSTRATLTSFYQSHDEKLKKLLDLDSLPWESRSSKTSKLSEATEESTSQDDDTKTKKVQKAFLEATLVEGAFLETDAAHTQASHYKNHKKHQNKRVVLRRVRGSSRLVA